MGFDPVSLALYAGVAGGGLSALGTFEGGQANKSADFYQAAVARNNATIAGQNADAALKAGEVATQNEAMKNAKKSAKVKAGQAASGVDVNTGSAVTVQQSQRELGELDAETVLHNAQLKRYGYQTQQTGYLAEATLDTAKGEQAPIGADLAALGGIASSASSLGMKWGQLGPKSQTLGGDGSGGGSDTGGFG
jgi:hypothetical protein